MARDATEMRSPHTRGVLCPLQLEKRPGSKEDPASAHPHPPKWDNTLKKSNFKLIGSASHSPPPALRLPCLPALPAGSGVSPGTYRSAKAPPPETPLWPLWRRPLRNRKRTPRRDGHPAESKLLVGSVTAAAVAAGVLLPTPSSRRGGWHGPKISAPASPPPVNPDVAVTDWVYFPLR